MIQFDKRGCGASDRVVGSPTLEERVDDLRAVMDAEGVETAAIGGVSEGGPMCMMFAALYPERVSHLVLTNTTATLHGGDDHPHIPIPEVMRQDLVAGSGIAFADWGSRLLKGRARGVAAVRGHVDLTVEHSCDTGRTRRTSRRVEMRVGLA